MGFILVSSTSDDLCTQIIITKVDSNSEVIKFLDECGFRIDSITSNKLDVRTERAYKLRSEVSGRLGDTDIMYKFSIGCNIPALGLVTRLTHKHGYSLKYVTSPSSGNWVNYVLQR